MLYIARVLQYLSYYSPLNAAADAHWLTRISCFWIWWQRVHERDAKAVHDAHLRLGPVIRLAPNELSVNDVNGGLKPIYEGRLPKTDLYQVANSYGEEPMVALKDEEAHRRRKRIVAKPYGKTNMASNLEWHTARTVLHSDLVSAVQSLAEAREESSLYDVFFAWSVASTSTYVFGQSGTLNLLNNIPEARRIREEYFSQRIYQFVGVVLPIPKKLFDRMGYFPEIPWIRQMQLRAEEAQEYSTEKAKDRKWTSVFGFTKQGLQAAKSNATGLTGGDSISAKDSAILSSEMQDHIIAGIDTSSAALAACAWLLSLDCNYRWQAQLREEIRSTQHGEVEQLPLLQAIIKETLRLYPLVAGGQPRVTDHTVQLGPPGYEVTAPPGVKVSSQAYTLHRSSVFDDPETFNPSRWLESSEARKREMNRWFWAFGSGSRGCLGENLGLSNLYVAVAAIYEHFETRVAEGTELIVSQGMIAMPIPNKHGDYIRLRMRRVAD